MGLPEVLDQVLEILPPTAPRRLEMVREFSALKERWAEADAEGRRDLWRQAAEAVNRLAEATPEQAEKIRQLFFSALGPRKLPPEVRACGNCQHWITDCVLAFGRSHALALSGEGGACILNPPAYIGMREGEPLFCPPLTLARHGCSQFQPRSAEPPGFFLRDVEKTMEKLRAQSQIARPSAPGPILLPGNWRTR